MGWNNQVVNLIILTEQTTGFSGIFGYSPTIGAGNLIFSVSAVAGTDPYGNAYPAGISATSGFFSGSIEAASIVNTVLTSSTFQGGNINNPAIAFNDGGTLLVYSASGNSQTYTTGSGHFTGPVGVTSLKAEVWGGGGGASVFGYAAGGAEYAAEYTLAVTPGNSYAYSVGAAGSAGVYQGASSTNGGNTSFAGDSVTVTAHGGVRGTSSSAGSGGTGSTNSIHFGGGAGGGPFFTGIGFENTGGGGGGAGGSLGVGGNGGYGTLAGGTAGVSNDGGGNGGVGGNGGNGGNGSSPGGGGGGASYTNTTPDGTAGAGGSGKISLSWLTGVTLVASIAAVAGTDSFGNAYPEGMMSNYSYLIPSSQPSTPGANCVLYYNSGKLFALGPSGNPITLATT